MLVADGVLEIEDAGGVAQAGVGQVEEGDDEENEPRAVAEEVAEILAVALLMDGGTASVYAPRAWEAYLEFRAALTPEVLQP